MTRQFLLLAGLRFAKLGLGVASLAVYGRLFGIGREMDAWVFGSGVVAAAGMLVWGPVNEISRARYMYQMAKSGEASALRGMNQLIRFSLLIGALIVALLIMCESPLIDLLYPNQEYLARRDVERLMIWMAPTLLLSQLLALGSAFLNCRGAIYEPEWIGLAGGVVNIFCVMAFAERHGVLALVLGFYSGLLVAIVATVVLLIREGMLQSGRLSFWGAPVRDYLKFSGPLFISYGAGQANGLLEKSLATSVGEGALSSVNYASQIKGTLQSVITSVLFSLAVPRLAQAATDDDRGRFESVWIEVQRLAFLFLLMLVPPIFGTSELIAQLLFKIGNAATVQQTKVASLIYGYVAALLPVALYLVHGTALLARQRGQQYAVWGVASQFMSAIVSIALLAPYGAMAFPIALVVSHSMAAVFMASAVGPSLPIWKETGMALILLAAVSYIWTLLAQYAQAATGSALLGLVFVSAAHTALLGLAYLCYRYLYSAGRKPRQQQ